MIDLFAHQEYSQLQLRQIRNKFQKLSRLNYVEKKMNISSRKIILIDFFPVPEWIVVNSTICSLLSNKFDSPIISFGFGRRNWRHKALYESVNIKQYLRMKLSIRQLIRLMKLFNLSAEQIRKPEDLINFEISGINLGIDIYESILRTGLPTVNIEEQETWRQIYLGLRQYIFFREYFEKKQILAVLPSHDSYIGPGLLSRMAYKYETVVISAGIYGIDLPQEGFQLCTKFARYRSYFNSLQPHEKELSLEKIKKSLDWDSYVMDATGLQMRVGDLTINKKREIKILVATHDFYDNPHAYSRMPFIDFYQWLLFLAEIAMETDYTWFIKCHPDSDGKEEEEIDKFVNLFPKFSKVDPKVSFNELKSNGLTHVTTCYGTVGQELPLLGITVINAAYNPHISYNFNIHAQNNEHYKKILSNLEKNIINNPVCIEEISEFKFVHEHLMKPNGLMIPSVMDYMKFSNGNIQSKEALEYFVQNLEEIWKKSTDVAIKSFANLNRFSCELLLIENEQIKVEINNGNREFFAKFRA